jgi:4-amino-4-deoxy-L-arabinose transferase-like glycosyltransferase
MMRSWEWLLLAAALLLFALQAGLSSPQKSAAFDEQYHLTRGYAYLRTGDFRMSQFHPPLINLLSAVPLLWRDDVVLPTDHPSWENSDPFIFARIFAWEANQNTHDLLVWARWPIIGLALVLLLILFVWARQMAGRWSSWLVLALAVVDPNLLANARLVTTDLGLTVMLTLAMWRAWCYLQRPSTLNLILLGIAAGLTMAAKFTGLMVWPMLFLILLLSAERCLPSLAGRSRLLAWGLTLAAVVLLAYLTVWAIFRFDVGRIPIPALAWLPPIPAPYYAYSVWDTFMAIEAQPKTSFLLGQISPRGWWYYFPVALLVKTPLPLLLLALVGGWSAIRRSGWRSTAVLWLPPLLFMALAMTGRIAIGYRHILPVVPFLLMLAAYGLKPVSGSLVWLTHNRWRAAVVLLLLGQVMMVTRIYPHYESFFNLLAGGPSGGDRILVDANIDWGQDLITLRHLMDEMALEYVYLSYFGTAPPEHYDLRYYPIPGFLRFVTGPEVNGYNPYSPPPGWYAISVTSLRLGLLERNVDLYAYFQDKEPVARAGYSINLYYVDYPETMPVVRTAVTETPVFALDPAQLGWVEGARLISKWTGEPDILVSPPAPSPELATWLTTPVQFGQSFQLVGYDLSAVTAVPGDTIELALVWQVTAENVGRTIAMPAPSAAAPLAAFVHISAEDPAQIIAQYDGWGTALTGLEQADRIYQPIRLTVPADAQPGSYYLRLGLYSPQSGHRLPLQPAAQFPDDESTPGLSLDREAAMITLTPLAIQTPAP